MVVRGPEKEVSRINHSGWQQEGNAIYLFTSEFGTAVRSPQTFYVALQLDKDMRVTAVVNGEVDKGVAPAFKQELDLPIEKGGFVLVAADDNYAERGYRRFLAENVRRGDVVKLRLNGELSSLADVVKQVAGVAVPMIQLDVEPMHTVVGTKATVAGQVVNFAAAGSKPELVLSGTAKGDVRLPLSANGSFSKQITLAPQTNYMTLTLRSGGSDLCSESLIFYSKASADVNPEVILWVEQFPNALKLTNDSAVEAMVAKSVEAGFTAIALDIKGPEGYVSYRKNELSHTPYFTATPNPRKHVEDTGFDLLESVLKAAHAKGLKLYASFNFFSEGNLAAQDYPILKDHPEWEELVQRPEDKGAILPMRQSRRGLDAAAGKNNTVTLFVNPLDKNVQDFQLLRVEEVLRNYPIDGVVLDRCRYDNFYADFSPLTAEAFGAWLAEQGKELKSFPADAFTIDADGNMVKGALFNEWLTFRSNVIKLFTDRVRTLIDSYKSFKNPDLKLAAYVGSWYEYYYQNGVNWASPDFVYNERLHFPESQLYGAAYNATSYLDNIDFLMIGTYYKTAREVNYYITLGNILTCGRLPLLGSMSLPDLKSDEQPEVFRASLTSSAGLMIFDHCYVKWDEFIKNMKEATAPLKR
jgi:hypothetical protein